VTHRPEDKRKSNGKSAASTPAVEDRDIALPELGGVEDSMISVVPRDAMFEDGEDSVTGQFIAPTLDEIGSPVLNPAARSIAPGEALQLVRYARRGNTLVISGLTPHGRRLTFEQREDRDGWYVVVAGRRRRPTERELGLVVASITQEVEAAMAPEESEVRSAYQLAAASDQPGMPIQGLQAYRDLLLDEAAAYTAGQIQRLAVVAIEYQAFKRFAIRHGHRIGAAFVRALGEQLRLLYGDEKMVHVFHKTGKSFRLIVLNRTAAEIYEMVDHLTETSSKKWLIERVWGRDQRTHSDEVNYHIGIAKASPAERESNYLSLAQRLNDDAYRASKLGQLKDHTSLVVAKNDYRTTIYQWSPASEDELEDLASQMDDGPAEVAAEMVDYLHELVPADLEGMSVDGDINALMFKAIARDGFWQGTTAMRIGGDRLIQRFLTREAAGDGEHNYVGGFDLGDEFYGIAIESKRLYFAWGDLNSAGSTRVRAGLERLQQAVGWRRADGGGIVGRFIDALAPRDNGENLPERIRRAADEAYEELSDDPHLHVNDTVDIADFLWTHAGELVKDTDIVEGSRLVLSLRGKQRRVTVLERRSGFIVLLDIDGVEHPAAVSDSITGPQVKLRVRRTVVSAAISVLEASADELDDILALIREDNNLDEDSEMDVVGFLRHIADILLVEQVKAPAKIELALGGPYSADNFVGVYTLEDVRERHPGLFYEAVHHTLLQGHPVDIDRHLRELIGHTMLASTRPAL
jgi:GGDEF domain-containing protein